MNKEPKAISCDPLGNRGGVTDSRGARAPGRPRLFLDVDRSFDHYVRLARRMVQVPVALVSILESDRQVFPGSLGLPEPYNSLRETPLSLSFCQYVVADAQPFVVTDARSDSRVAGHPAIVELDVIAYLGWPLVDATGATIGSLCAIDHAPRDWTFDELETVRDLATACSAELQHTAQLARDSENLAQAIFESVDVAVAFYDDRQRLVVANDLAHRAAKAAGFHLDQPPYAGPHVRQSDNQTQVPLDEQIIPRALRGELQEHEMEWLGSDGHQVAVLAAARSVSRADGSMWGTVITAHDVTALARALKVKDDFVATVSHELRTPLTSIMGYAELLLGQLDPRNQPAAASLATIRRAAGNLQARISDLLDTAESRRALQLEPTDVTALVAQTAATFTEQAKKRVIDLRVDVTDPLGIQWAVVDPRRLEQAVENVVSNALKYTGEGGHVLVRVGGDDDTVEITVADDGVGMSADEVDQAFDSFWRADTARTQAVQGVGIGLTLVRDILNAHHGTVTIASRPHHGTTIVLAVPRNHSI